MTPAEKIHPDDAERRAGPRYQPEQTIDIELLADGRRSRAVVRDISLRGMKLAPADACAVGSRVLLEHPVAGSFHGVCIWRDEEEVGVELFEPAREIERVLQCLCLLVGVTASSRAK